MSAGICFTQAHFWQFLGERNKLEQCEIFIRKTQTSWKWPLPALCTHFIPKGFHSHLWMFPLWSRNPSSKQNERPVSLAREGAFLKIDFTALCSMCVEFNEIKGTAQVLRKSGQVFSCIRKITQVPAISSTSGEKPKTHLFLSFLRGLLNSIDPCMYECSFPTKGEYNLILHASHTGALGWSTTSIFPSSFLLLRALVLDESLPVTWRIWTDRLDASSCSTSLASAIIWRTKKLM